MAIRTAGTYDIGDRPVIQNTFTDAAGALADPTTVVFIVRKPDGTETPYTSPNAAIVKQSTGVWWFTFPTTIDVDGPWYVRGKATAGLICADEVKLVVRDSAFTTP